jgi:hypothetical protein
MSTQTQFGHTLFLDGFQAGSKAEKLNRLHFLKNASSPAPYDEAWLQRLIMRHPSLLPVDQIEPAFNPLVPICIELPMKSGFLDNLLVTPARWPGPGRVQALAQPGGAAHGSCPDH